MGPGVLPESQHGVVTMGLYLGSGLGLMWPMLGFHIRALLGPIRPIRGISLCGVSGEP